MSGCCAGRHHVTGKLEPGCTRRNETFYCIILVQKSPVSFLYHNTGRACHEKILEVFERAAKRRIFSTEQGLSEMQVKKIRETCGENILEEGKRPGLLRVFLSQFADLLIVILLIAALISMCSGNAESTIVIAVVLVMNAVLGTVQHQKAEKSLDSLKNLSAPCAKVIREGKKKEIPSRELVPGDLVELEAGDMVVADGRILDNYSLQVNESALTGESTNVEKTQGSLPEDLPLADRRNMVYSGSLVTYGRAQVLVTGTGMHTEIGKIAGMMNDIRDRKTPLQVSLDQFSRKLAVLVMGISAVVLGLCLYRKMPLLDALMFAVALAVAAIPEALSSIVTIVQAMGTQKMVKENAIVRKLKAVESLGCVSVICSDKTGTLTQNKMTVQKVYVDDREYLPGQLSMEEQLHRYLVYDAVLSNDATLENGKGIGDPTEYALLEMFRKIPAPKGGMMGEGGYREEMLRSCMKRLEEVPFDSERKRMSTRYCLHGVGTILTKGAPDVLLERCDFVRKSTGIVPLDPTETEKIKKKIAEFSGQGLRVLAFAYKESEETADHRKRRKSDLSRADCHDGSAKTGSHSGGCRCKESRNPHGHDYRGSQNYRACDCKTAWNLSGRGSGCDWKGVRCHE